MGMIRCDNCGRTLTYSIDKRRQDRGVYVCSTYRVYGLARCTSHYIRYDYLCKYVYDCLLDLKSKAQHEEKNLFNNIIRQKQSEDEIIDKDLCDENKLIERLETIRKVFIQMYEDYALDKIPLEEYHHLKQLYEKEKSNIKDKLKEIQNITTKISKYTEDIHQFIDNLKKMKMGSELSRKNIDLLIEKIIISDIKDELNRKIICIYYKNIGIIK